MKNYYEFNNLIDDGETFDFFNSLSYDTLKKSLDNSFTYIEDYLTNFADVFKNIFNDYDYDELYYSCLALIEELNDIKIILNILKGRDNHE